MNRGHDPRGGTISPNRPIGAIVVVYVLGHRRGRDAEYKFGQLVLLIISQKIDVQGERWAGCVHIECLS
jgi:hypothetical protein